MQVARVNDIRTFQDGDRRIIGRASWQNCVSITYGVAAAYNRKEVSRIAAEMRSKSVDELEAMKRVFRTDARFEQACADGGLRGGLDEV